MYVSFSAFSELFPRFFGIFFQILWSLFQFSTVLIIVSQNFWVGRYQEIPRFAKSSRSLSCISDLPHFASAGFPYLFERKEKTSQTNKINLSVWMSFLWHDLAIQANAIFFPRSYFPDGFSSMRSSRSANIPKHINYEGSLYRPPPFCSGKNIEISFWIFLRLSNESPN